MATPTESLPCPVLGCSLPLWDHRAVDEPWVEVEPGSVWHSDGSTGAQWAAPDGLIAAALPEGEHREFAATGYSDWEDQLQRDHQARQLDWVQSDWLQSLEDISFAHRRAGVELSFSGDLRLALEAHSRGDSDAQGQDEHR